MDANDKLRRLREWCLSHKPSGSGYDDLPARLADAKRYAMEAVIEQVDRLLAEPAASAGGELVAAAEKALQQWHPVHDDSDCAAYIDDKPCDCGSAGEFAAHDELRAAIAKARETSR